MCIDGISLYLPFFKVFFTLTHLLFSCVMSMENGGMSCGLVIFRFLFLKVYTQLCLIFHRNYPAYPQFPSLLVISFKSLANDLHINPLLN